MRLLLDTDIGSDIDDAVCLAYLLAQRDCQLLSITTVTGQATQRAMLADALCQVAGQDVPILPGLESPLLIAARQPHAPQATALDKWPHRTEFPQGQAIEFLRQQIRQSPGEVVLLAIGPLTNIAALFTVDPEIPALLKSLVLMGGNYMPVRWGHAAGIPIEWNILNDPHAAAIVFRAPVPVIRCVGLDVTTQVTMSADEVKRRFSAKLLRPVLDFSEVWFQGSQKLLTFHDLLAAATIFDPHICRFEPGQVEIELQSEKLAGFTYWNPRVPATNQEVATSVDASRFFDHYFSQFADDPRGMTGTGS
jgi:inosine-uridine nucleoside N-ribohydrolase